MDIPLKSRPKVSTVNLIDESKFHIGASTTPINEGADSSQLKISKTRNNNNNNQHTFPEHYTFTRRFSETEKNNFDPETGHRIFEEGKIRPKSVRHDQLPSSHTYANLNDYNQLYSKSHDNLTRNTTNTSDYTTQSNTPRSRDASYLDLNQLHAQVAPQPIRPSLNQSSKFSYTKLHEYMKSKQKQIYDITEDNDITPLTKDNFATESPASLSNKREISANLDTLSRKKQKSAVDITTGDVNYELILNSLPPNFNELPYSQRKKLVKSFGESIDYSQFSLKAKDYFGSNNNSFTRRSRVGSVNSIASRLLARTSTTDLKKLQKLNGDQKEVILDHCIGKVIGYGQFGTIKECTSTSDYTVRAIKVISKNDPKSSTREIDIWRKLDHPNIIPLLSTQDNKECIYALMPKLDRSLYDVVRDMGVYDVEFNGETQRSRLRHMVKYLKQIHEVLHYLHDEMHIVHADLKLENILLDVATDKVVLIDFGMARYFDANKMHELQHHSHKFPVEIPDEDGHVETQRKSEFTKTSSNIIGSLPYAAPELLSINPPALLPSADIWALGVLIYGFIVGRLPFASDYEPKLRLLISQGNYDKQDLSMSLLMIPFEKHAETHEFFGKTKEQKPSTDEIITNEFQPIKEIVEKCLQVDISKRITLKEVSEKIELL
ncbi:NNK1 Nitrogen network kinase 1 [Candida maltosa Xu316]